MHRLSLVFALSACSGSDKTTTFPPAPQPATAASLAGHRCTGATCACRGEGEDDATEQQPPAEGLKRFEFRVGTVTGMAWVTVDQKEVLYKDVQRAEDCFYLDLP